MEMKIEKGEFITTGTELGKLMCMETMDEKQKLFEEIISRQLKLNKEKLEQQKIETKEYEDYWATERMKQERE